MATQLAKGNSAVIIGAMYAGCDCFFGYPITPASEVLHDASTCFPQAGRNFVQAESEEAAINMVYGAAGTGHLVMTASSGPGISLMQEGISYIAGAEIPAVIVDIMRAGPGLGNIGPEQGDYNQIVKGGGHGNYSNIVLAPASVQEMCDLTIRAFELAVKYRNPAFVLADGVLGQMIEPLRIPETAHTPKIDTSWAVCGNEQTRGNLVTSIYLDFGELEELNLRLQRKYELIEREEVDYEEFMTEDATTILVSYGISSRICRTAVTQARKDGKKVGLFRPKTLMPFPRKRLHELAQQAERFISVEMSNGQMRDDIKLAIDCARPVSLVSRLGGTLISLGQIMREIENTGVDK